MPRLPIRRKSAANDEAPAAAGKGVHPAEKKATRVGSPSWLAPVMVALFVVGLLWIVVYYLSQQQYPLPVGHWNMAIGFGFIMGGFAMSTQWK